MGIIAGIDEAGYGPILGPLVVSMTAFRTPNDELRSEGTNLWEQLTSRVVLTAPPKGRKGGSDKRLVVCDSKLLKRGKRGLDRMEESVLAFVATAPAAPTALCDGSEALSLACLEEAFGFDSEQLSNYPWYRDFASLALPRWGFRSEIRRKRSVLTEALAAAGVETLAVRPVAVHPAEFNRGVKQAGNKHLLEWTIVGRFVRTLFRRFGSEGVRVTVDQLGGRRRYGPILAQLLPQARVKRQTNGVGDDPVYVITQGDAVMHVRFRQKADQKTFEVALASMMSKYLRELLMQPLNAFFEERIPGLKPTAGYYVDGRRFLEDIGGTIAALSLDRELLVRCA